MIGFWDVVLVLAVTVQAVMLAYTFDPRWKAFILMLPIPFTFATLAVARPVDATHVLGLVLLLLFTHAVRVLHYDLRMPIILSIVLAAGGYCAVGWAVAGVLPTTEWTFWLSAAATVVVALAAMRLVPHREESGHKSLTPLWIKLPTIIAVVLLLVAIKHGLRGFMTLFPMVGVIGAYEARKCLWTVNRAIPAAMLTILPMMAASHVTQGLVGLGLSLVIGWGVFLCVLVPLSRLALFPNNRSEEDLELSES